MQGRCHIPECGRLTPPLLHCLLQVPFILAAYEVRQAEDKANHEESQRASTAAHLAAWDTDIVEKQRLVSRLG